MPNFTVTVKNDETGETKTVTVNTDNMEAAIVPAVLSAESVESDEKTEEPVKQSLKGGKRSTPSFRLKKRRITRKITKAR
jgi:hypothetical protein